MNKKFASLGTVLSRDEAKKVVGGNGPGTICACNSNYDCVCGSTDNCIHDSENSHCLICNGKRTCA